MSEEDRRSLEAITQNVHFFFFLSHQKTPLFTLSYHLIEIVKHTLSKGDFQKSSESACMTEILARPIPKAGQIRPAVSHVCKLSLHHSAPVSGSPVFPHAGHC